jgi:hypothetical protein
VVWVGVEDAITEAEVIRQEDFLIWIYDPTQNISRRNKGARPDDLTATIKNAIDSELLKVNRG